MLDTIKKMLAEEFNLDEDSILADSKLEADLGINSLELAELAFRLEEEFGIRVIGTIPNFREAGHEKGGGYSHYKAKKQ